MKNTKKLMKGWFVATVIGILLAGILCLPTNFAMAQALVTVPVPTQVDKNLVKLDQNTLEQQVLNKDYRNLEKDFRKAYNLGDDVDIYIEISTNPPPVLHKQGELIPAGTKVWAWDSPLPNPSFVVALWAVITVVVVAITVGGVLVYIAYKMLKALNKLLPKQSTNQSSQAISSQRYDNNPSFDMSAPIGPLLNNLVECNNTNIFDMDTLTGTIAFNVQTSTNLFGNNWVTELHVVNQVNAGNSVVTVYDGNGVPIVTNNNGYGLYDGNTLVFTPTNVTGVIIKSSAVDAQKYWRFQTQ